MPIVVDPQNKNNIYTGYGNTFYKTTTGATDVSGWTSVKVNASATGPFKRIVLDENNPATIYAVLDDGLFISVNSGGSWQKLTSPVSKGINDLVLDPTTAGLLYAATAQGVYKSEDMGTSWSTFNDGLFEREVNTLYLYSGKYLYANYTIGGFARHAVTTKVVSVSIASIGNNLAVINTRTGIQFHFTLAERGSLVIHNHHQTPSY